MPLRASLSRLGEAQPQVGLVCRGRLHTRRQQFKGGLCAQPRLSLLRAVPFGARATGERDQRLLLGGEHARLQALDRL